MADLSLDGEHEFDEELGEGEDESNEDRICPICDYEGEEKICPYCDEEMVKIEEAVEVSEAGRNGIGFLTAMGLIALVYFLFFAKKNTWKGFYYPNMDNLDYYIESPIYNSLDECRNWVNTQVYRYNPDGYGYDYECGKNCRLKEGFTEPICEETVR